MSERVTVSPESVRGLGDIVSPKTSEDFITYRSVLTETNGVYTITYETKSVTLTVDSASIEYGESVVLTATVTDEGEPAVGETVTFYKGTTEIGTDTTDSEGKATYTVTGLNIGNHSFNAEYDIYTSNTVNVTVNKITSTISLSADHSTITYGDNVVLSGVLSVGSGLTVKLYENNVYVKDLTTSTGGAFSETVSTPSAGSHNFRVEYAGDTEYTSASASVTVTVNKIPTTVTLSTDKAIVNYSELFTLSGQVSVPEIAQLIILKNNQNYETISCDSNGDFSRTYIGSDGGVDEYIVTYGGTSIYASSASAPVTVTTVDDLLLEFTGNHFTTGQNTPFEYTGTVIIDWGDNTTETYTGGPLSHTYSSSGDYSIKIQGEINAIKSAGFYGCDGLTKVTVPASVTSMEGYCFSDCDDLTEIELRWFGLGSISPIPSSVSSWILNSSSFKHFLIPDTTTHSYTAKGYPSNLLKEKGATPVPASITLSTDKPIMMTGETATITATVLDGDGNPCEGETVSFEVVDGEDLGTATTDSSGECSVYYLGKGTGDLYVKGICGIIFTEIYVQDCTYYNGGTITGSQTLNIPNLPVNFKATYKLKKTGNDALSWLNVGNDANNCFFFGQIGSDAIGIFKIVNGTNTALKYEGGLVQQGVEYLMEFTYNNGSLTLIGCGRTLTASYTETNRGFVSTNISVNNSMKELKIKPL